MGSDEARDLAILKIISDVEPSLKLANSENVEIGETVYAVGNPKGLSGTFSAGIVSGIREFEGDSLLRIAAPISPGSGGGPVLNSNSEVVGIAVAFYKEGQNLNFAIPSNYLKELITKIGPVQKFSSRKRGPKESTSSSIGRKSTEGVVGTHFRWGWSNENYSISFKNNLRENVTNISALVIFKDKNGEHVDCVYANYTDIVPARLAARYVSTGDPVGDSVYEITMSGRPSGPEDDFIAERIEVRILGFEVVE